MIFNRTWETQDMKKNTNTVSCSLKIRQEKIGMDGCDYSLVLI